MFYISNGRQCLHARKYPKHRKTEINTHVILGYSIKAGEKVPDNKDGNKDEEKKDESKGMSGIGIFFTIVLVLAAVYFIGGAFYNFKVYNARGRDLIPHLGKLFLMTIMTIWLTKCLFI